MQRTILSPLVLLLGSIHLMSCSSTDNNGANDKKELSSKTEIDYSTILKGVWGLGSDWGISSNGDTIVGDYFGSVKFDFRSRGVLFIIGDSMTPDKELIEVELSPVYYSIKGAKFKIDSLKEAYFLDSSEEYDLKMPYPFSLSLIPQDLRKNRALGLTNMELLEKYCDEQNQKNK